MARLTRPYILLSVKTGKGFGTPNLSPLDVCDDWIVVDICGGSKCLEQEINRVLSEGSFVPGNPSSQVEHFEHCSAAVAGMDETSASLL